MKKILTLLVLLCIFNTIVLAQRYRDTNVGLYPNGVQLTINGRNTALGVRYSHLFEKSFFGVPVGLYASFSNTTHPDLRFINYDWERKYAIGGIITLPYDPKSMHTMVTVGIVRNEHPVLLANRSLYRGQFDGRYYETNNWGCDIGVQVQQKRFTSHITVDALNFMRYVEIGVGYCFSFYAH